MEFEINEGRETRVTLSGKLDFARAPLLMDELAKLKGKDICRIVFECGELTYISSAGIRVVIYAQQKITPNMEICFENVNDEIREVLDICGLTDFIEIRETR